ncbi:MAG: hypothetical protein B0W54_13500 [Cellvibrio sp. 79]|nr:MAG: hypothetical protein B0W54_13500 [Cellvibrio sp. 79]
MKHFLRTSPAGILLGIISSGVAAQELGGHISISSGESDNAFKSASNFLSERQDTYEAGLAGGYNNQYLSATAEYTGQDKRFAKNSQEDRRFLDGSSSMLLGSLSSPIDLQVKHSQRTLLSAPDDLNVTTNQDEREIVSVIPRIRKRITDADLLSLSADHSQIEYAKNELNNSTRTQGELSWLHTISRVNDIRFLAQQSDISFDNFEFADYRYTNYAVVYSTGLRKLSYSLMVGYNKSEREIGGDYSGSTYSFDASYKAPLHSFKLISGRSITDSSMGGGNVQSVNQNPTSDGAHRVDQIERTNTELSWSTEFICNKCSTDISLYQNSDDYLVLGDEGRQQGAAFTFAYAFTKKSRLSYRISDMKQEFSGSLEGRNYTYQTQAVEYEFKFTESLGFSAFYEREDRDSNSNQRTYIEEFIGASVTYSF